MGDAFRASRQSSSNPLFNPSTSRGTSRLDRGAAKPRILCDTERCLRTGPQQQLQPAVALASLGFPQHSALPRRAALRQPSQPHSLVGAHD
jgi:hypothetical protein